MRWHELNLLLLSGITLTGFVEYTAGRRPLEREGAVTGNVAVVTMHPEVDGFGETAASTAEADRSIDLVLLVDEVRGSDGPDGVADRMFRLQRPPGTSLGYDARWEGAEVTWAVEAVRVTVEGVEVLALGTSSSALASGPHDLSDPDLPRLSGHYVHPPLRRAHPVRFGGYGLSHRQDVGIALPGGGLAPEVIDDLRARITQSDEVCPCSPGGSPDGTTCAIGGCPTAPQQCGIACGIGAFACCGCGQETGKACCRCLQVGR